MTKDVPLLNREVEPDGNEHIDRRTRETSGGESPLSNGHHCFFIEAGRIEGPDDTDA